MSKAERAKKSAHAYASGNALSIRNKARRTAAGLGALADIAEDKVLLVSRYPKVRTCTLGDYQAANEVAGLLIDQGREPYLIRREVLLADMTPFTEVWDVGVELLKVGRGGRSFFRQDMVMASTQVGDALLPTNTLLAWF